MIIDANSWNFDKIRGIDMKETYTREEVVEMLRDMQKETLNCVGFIAGTVTQLWVLEDMLGKRIEELGGESVEYKVIRKE